MSPLDHNHIKRLLGVAIYSRALDYQRSGRVLQLSRQGSRLEGRVRGSQGNEYDVRVELDRQGEVEDARCSCPYPDLCKHVGAVLLQAIEEGERTAEAEVEETDEVLELPGPAGPQRGRTHPQRGAQPAAHRRTGAAGPRAEVPAAAGSERFRLVFVVQESLQGVDPAGRRRWLLVAALRFLRQDGSFGRWQEYRPSLAAEPVSGAARTLLAYLQHKEEYRDYLDPYLDLLASAPRLPLFLRCGGEIKRLFVAQIQEARVRFRLSGLEGREPQFLPEVELRGAAPAGGSRGSDAGGGPPDSDPAEGSGTSGRTVSAVVEPPLPVHQRGPLMYLVAESAGLLFYRRNDPTLQRLLPSLLGRAQPRTAAAIRELQGLAAGLPDGSGPRGVSTALQVAFAARRVRLLRRRPASVVEIEERAEGLNLRLLFSYEGALQAFPAREALIMQEGSDEEYVAVRRAEGFENDRFLRLSALLGAERGAATTAFSGEREATLVVEQGLGEFLLEHGDALVEEGFELRRRGRSIRRVRSLSFTATSGEDWLDLEVEAVGEEGERLALDPRALDGPFLNRGETCYVLGREDIARLQELARQGELKAGRYRLSSQHYGLIDSLYEQIANRDEDFLARIRRIMEGLRGGAIEAVDPPEGFAGALRDYQRSGLGWLWFLCAHGVNGCLADDMGLGKTVQTLALLQKLKGEGKLERALIVAPVSTLANWEQEVRRFTPELAVSLHHGPLRARDAARLRGQDILLTSYHTLRQDLDTFRSLHFTYVILDEAQTIKNPLSQIHRAARLVPASLRLSLTGTPLENRSVELWAQMSFLNPGLLGTLPAFRRRFAKPIEEEGDERARETLRRMIHPFILRRRKQDVLRELPPKEELLLYARMEPAQERAYAELRESYRRRVLQVVDERGVERSAVQIFEALLKLRQAALFPGMASPRYERVPSCKFDLLQVVLEEVLEEGHKVLLFSQFLESLRRIRAWVEGRGVGYAYLDGATRDRAAAIASFQNDPATRLFLVSLRAGGLGINLTAADYVVLFDPWWNPAVEAQAVDRSHRIGRRGKVIVYRMITQGTVEEKVLQLQERKRRLMEDLVATDSGAFKSLTREDVLRLFE